MASIAVVPLAAASLQAEHLAWIRKFALDKYQTDVSEVKALFIPGYQGGGGGLYMKKKELGFNGWLQGARDALGPKRISEANGMEKGNVIFVRELAPKAKTGEAVTVMWIMWHEMGHAVGDRQAKPDTSEPYAYSFEYHALTEAQSSGKLATWNVQLADLKTFYETRKDHTKDSAHRQQFESLFATKS